MLATRMPVNQQDQRRDCTKVPSRVLCARVPGMGSCPLTEKCRAVLGHKLQPPKLPRLVCLTLARLREPSGLHGPLCRGQRHAVAGGPVPAVLGRELNGKYVTCAVMLLASGLPVALFDPRRTGAWPPARHCWGVCSSMALGRKLRHPQSLHIHAAGDGTA